MAKATHSLPQSTLDTFQPISAQTLHPRSVGGQEGGEGKDAWRRQADHVSPAC
jgi:hypothetical protein